VVAACAASIAVEGEGPAALAGLPQVGARVAWYDRHLPAPGPE
jgi:hypothetical protein